MAKIKPKKKMKLNDLNKKIKEQKERDEDGKCPDCHDTGIVHQKGGDVHTCFKCLKKGRLDNA